MWSIKPVLIAACVLIAAGCAATGQKTAQPQDAQRDVSLLELILEGKDEPALRYIELHRMEDSVFNL